MATNAVLERRGARVALVVTEGFEDVIRIGRQTRPELYNIFVPLPRPIVEPDLTFGISERLDASGQVLIEVDDATVDRVAATFRDRRPDIVAVCLLHSYANPAHEQRVADRLRAAGWRVSTSSDVLPEYREYERWSTTVVNAYVTPLIDRYLGALESKLGDSRLSIMVSDVWGRKRSYLTYLALAAVFVLAYTSTSNLWVLLALGPITAFFATGFFSGFGAVTAEIYPTAVRATAQGFTYNIGRVASAFAPAVAGTVARTHGYPAALAIAAAAFVAAMFFWIFIPETKGRKIQ